MNVRMYTILWNEELVCVSGYNVKAGDENGQQENSQ
jgi:hypothetical protein